MQGLIHGTYSPLGNTADLHVNPGQGAFTAADMLTVAEDLYTAMDARYRQVPGPGLPPFPVPPPVGTFVLHPTGAAIVKIVIELLAASLGGTWSTMKAALLQKKRKLGGGGGPMPPDTIDPSVVPEHVAFLDSLRGTNGVSIRPRLPNSGPYGLDPGTQQEREAEADQDMLATSAEGNARYEKYKGAITAGVPASLDVSLTHQQLPQIIAVLRKRANG